MLKSGWEVKTLGDIAEVKGGKRVPKGYVLQSEPTKHPYLTVSDFSDDGAIDTSKLRYISDDIFESIKRYTISSFDLYLSIAGTIGKTGYVPIELDGANLTENACKLVLNPIIDRGFIYYFTKSNDFLDQVGINTRTTTQPKLALERLKTIQIPVPPLPEQTRIVAILDEAFANISQAVANAEKNLANARELFDSYLNEVFTRKGEGYKEVTLGKEVSLLTGFPFKSKDFTDKPSDIKLLRGDNVIHAKLRWTDVKRWEASQSDSFKDYTLLENDIVIAMDRTWISSGIKYAQLTKHDLPCLLVQRVARLRAYDNIDSVFLKFIIGSKMFEQYVISVQTGIGVPHISGGQISAFTFWMPKIKEQQKVAQKLTILEENMQQLEDVYRRKLAALAELKQALLQKAFTGELTAADQPT